MHFEILNGFPSPRCLVTLRTVAKEHEDRGEGA